MIRSKPEPRTVPCSSMVTCTPVLPRVRLGISTGLAGCFRAPDADAGPSAATATSAPDCRNVRRSVLGVSCADINCGSLLSRGHMGTRWAGGSDSAEVLIASRAAYPRVRCALRYYDLQQTTAASPELN